MIRRFLVSLLASVLLLSTLGVYICKYQCYKCVDTFVSISFMEHEEHEHNCLCDDVTCENHEQYEDIQFKLPFFLVQQDDEHDYCDVLAVDCFYENGIPSLLPFFSVQRILLISSNSSYRNPGIEKLCCYLC